MILKAVRTLTFEYSRNRNAGTVAWILHRVCGLGLLGYIIVHVWVLSSAIGGMTTMTGRLMSVQGPMFHFLEIALIAVILFHTFNGIRIVLADLLAMTLDHRVMAYLTYLFTIAGTAYAAMLIVPRTLGH